MKHNPKPTIRILTFIALAMMSFFSSTAHATEKFNGQVEFRPGYTWLDESYGEMEGFSFGAMGGWRFFDSLILKLDTELGIFDIHDNTRMNLFQCSLGLNYDIDRTYVTPTLGMGVGPMFRKYGEADWLTDVAWHFLAAAVYHIVPNVALGLEIRYNFILEEGSSNSFYMTLGAKLAVLF